MKRIILLITVLIVSLLLALPGSLMATYNNGCTPGYWKQPHHLDNWPSAEQLCPADWDNGNGVTDPRECLYSTAFGVDPAALWMADQTLIGALTQGGGGEKALGRHSVAALLNAYNYWVDSPHTPGGVMGLVQDAYANSTIWELKHHFAVENELDECPLN